MISNPAAPVYISGNTTLTLSNGIDLASATVNLTVDCGTINLGMKSDVDGGRRDGY